MGKIGHIASKQLDILVTVALLAAGSSTKPVKELRRIRWFDVIGTRQCDQQ